MVGIILDQNTLHQYVAENNSCHQRVYKGSPVIDRSADAILKGFFDSLMPYIDNPQKLTKKISALKTQEAIELLLQKDDCFENILFDFQKPHKINLEAFMNINYKYNVSLATFAKLTGRCLSSFKRDFAKTCILSPEK
ncbi:hypothetical protein IEE83_18535 [Dyadobacter sp. UP-52]|uniref:ExsA-like N-terminal regulatory domain-containing protein n=1 Tax=Dyadobacter subterraneus TaxID=2773304 RepID=A0ABR9WFH4_9BACT|nr:hypothetical protein [Dyadobacter subterraneus]